MKIQVAHGPMVVGKAFDGRKSQRNEHALVSLSDCESRTREHERVLLWQVAISRNEI